LVAKEVTDKEGFVKKFGLEFGGDIHWKAAPVLLDHLSRSPLFKAVFVSMSKPPFQLEPDIPEELQGRLEWAKRNFNFHKDKANSLKLNIEQQEQSGTIGGVVPIWLPKQLKEEQEHAKKFLDECRAIEASMQEHMKNYFLIKENLIAVALFFYIYTNPMIRSIKLLTRF
jgi:hypothetical protein